MKVWRKDGAWHASIGAYTAEGETKQAAIEHVADFIEYEHDLLRRANQSVKVLYVDNVPEVVCWGNGHELGYSILSPFSTDYATSFRNVYPSSGYSTTEILRHVAQLHWLDPDHGYRIVDKLDKEGQREHLHWVAWQLAYKSRKDAGDDANTAHQWATWNADQFIERAKAECLGEGVPA